MKLAFDNAMYLELQSKKIKERLNQFGTKLYLEFGGKLFDDFHASRVLPGFASNAKIKTLMALKDEVEMIIVVNANDIQIGKMRYDIGITYDQEVLRMMELFNELDLKVCGVVITQFAHQELAVIFKNKLENMGIKVYLHSVIPGYPLAIDYILSETASAKRLYRNPRPLVVVTAPGPGSCKSPLAYRSYIWITKKVSKAFMPNTKLSRFGICRSTIRSIWLRSGDRQHQRYQYD